MTANLSKKFGKKKTPQKLFTSEKTVMEGSRGIARDVKLSSLGSSNILSTASFRYDDPADPLKSTQEIVLDWSKFENHTFFNSAQSKVNVAFDVIVNKYPFDGNEKDIESFEDSLTGFENYVLQTFPKHAGYLYFSGTKKQEDPAFGYSEGTRNTYKCKRQRWIRISIIF